MWVSIWFDPTKQRAWDSPHYDILQSTSMNKLQLLRCRNLNRFAIGLDWQMQSFFWGSYFLRLIFFAA